MLMRSRLDADLAPRSGWRTRLSSAIADLWQGLVQWRTWWVLASNDIRQRYRRTALGQFWVTASIAATIAGMSIVFGLIFKQPLGDYTAFLATGFVFWALLSNLVNELSTSFISSENYLRSYSGPRSAIIYRVIARNLLVWAHNLAIIPLVLLLCQVPVDWTLLLVLPGIALIVLNAVWIGLLLGSLSARFRDLPQIIANVVQLAFFLTPIIYRPAQIREQLWVLTHLNPFANFLEIVREPLLGVVPEAHHYFMVLAWTIVGFLIALPFYARYRGRIVYWL
jgi:ABC-type polysaccharide/polyol phosphate export permease